MKLNKLILLVTLLPLFACGGGGPQDPCELFPELCQPPTPAEPYDCDNESNLTGVVQVAEPTELERYIVVLTAPSFQEAQTLQQVTGRSIQALERASPKSLLSRRVGILSAEIRGTDVVQLASVGRYGAFVAGFSAEQVKALATRPGVDYVQRDGIKRINAIPYSNDRSNERARQIDGDESTGDGADGTNVHVFITDTGIWTPHTEFGGEVSPDCFTAHTFGGCEDQHDHGTHVASNVSSKTFGVARGAVLHSVRVLDERGSGSDSDVIRGIDWVTEYCAARPEILCVGNMSLGGGASPALDAAVCRSIKSGVQWALAAGNESTDACTTSPARVKQALTVGSVNQSDGLSSFSNRGQCVDVLAVGDPTQGAIRNNRTDSFRGTSMASPEACAVLALEAQRNPTGSPADWKAAVLGNATPDLISGVPAETPNLLIYSKR